jgi:hypothetical protein
MTLAIEPNPVGNCRGMAKRNRIPKKGDRVGIQGDDGVFVVYDVDESLECAELKQIGRGLALSSIPWSKWTFVDESDSSQNALRPDIRQQIGSKGERRA